MSRKKPVKAEEPVDKLDEDPEYLEYLRSKPERRRRSMEEMAKDQAIFSEAMRAVVL